MGELAIVLAILLGLGTTAFVFGLPWDLQFFTGLALLALGASAGIPASILYHVQLRRRLLARRALPPRWWLSPVPLHERLHESERRAVMPWFYAGAASFLLMVLGGLLALIAAWRTR
jgi:hypothetical protein